MSTGWAAASAATTAATPLTINATVLKVCVAGVGTPITMASITQTSGLTGSGTVIVTCTAGTTYDVMLDEGANAASNAAPDQRLMKSTLGTATLTYGIYQDAAYTTLWGSTVGTNTLHETASGLADTWPVYIKVNSASAAAATVGNYTDVVQLSVQY